MRVAEVRQLSPIATGVDPDRAISTKGDDFAGWQSGDLFNLAVLVRSRWVRLRHDESVRTKNNKSSTVIIRCRSYGADAVFCVSS
jgi:hypothetical protein